MNEAGGRVDAAGVELVSAGGQAASGRAGAGGTELEIGFIPAALGNPGGAARSAAVVNGEPELVFAADNSPVSAAAVSTASATGAVVLGTASAQGLSLISNLYELGPENTTFDPPAVLTFRYSSAALAGLGVPETQLALFEFFPGSGWVLVPGQVHDTANHLITASFTTLSSLFGVFALETTPPVAAFSSPAEGALLNTRAPLIVLSYFDPETSPGVPGSGISTASVRILIDGMDLTALAVISSAAATLTPPSLADGTHTVKGLVSDEAGNGTMTLRSFRIDATPPSVAISTPANGALLADARSRLSAVYADLGSGLDAATLKLSLDGKVEVQGAVGGGDPGPWTATTQLPAGRQAPAVAAANGFLYVLSGSVNNVGLSGSVVFAKIDADGTLGPWTETSPLPIPRQNHRALAVGNVLYVLGGHTGSSALNDVSFAPINANGSLGSWSSAAAMPFPGGTGTFGAVAANGFIYVMGGENFSCGVHAQAFFARACPTGLCTAWTQTASLPQGLDKFDAAVADGSIYIAGGNSVGCGNSALSGVLHSEPDPATGQLSAWKTTAALPRPAINPVGLGAPGRLFALGGGVFPSVSNVVMFASLNPDHSVKAWTDDPRFHLPKALTLAEGEVWASRLYVVAGVGADGLGSRDVYFSALSAGLVHSATATFTPVAALSEGTHTVTASILDLAGSTGSASASFTVDTVAPSLSLTVDGATATAASSPLVRSARPTIRATYLDATSGADPASFTMSLDNLARTAAASGDAALFVPGEDLAQGAHSVAISIRDRAGNLATLSASFKVDSVPPRVAVSTPADGAFVADDKPPVAASYSDLESGLDLTTLRLSLDGVVVATAAASSGGGTAGELGPWSATTAMPAGRQAPAVAVSNGYLYVLGGAVSGVGLSNSVVFAPIGADGKLGPWTQTAPIPIPRQNHRALAVGGKLYVLGGHTNTGALNDVSFAPINANGTLGAWSSATSMPFPGGTGTFGAVAHNGFVYVMGGENFSCGVHSQAFFAKVNADGTLGAWTLTASLPQALDKFDAVVVNGSIFVAGGNSVGCGNQALSTVFHGEPDPATGQLSAWKATTALPKPAINPVAFSAQGRLFIVGGGVFPSVTNTVMSAAPNPDHSVSGWTDDPKFYLTKALSLAEGGASENRLYVAGGLPPDGNPSADVFVSELSAGLAQSATATFTPLAALAQGTHTVSASISDLAGSTGSATTSFTVDTVAPSLSLTVDGATATATLSPLTRSVRPNIRASYSDATSGADPASFTLLLNNIARTATAGADAALFVPGEDLAQGNHAAIVSIRDRAGNLATLSVSFRVDSVSPQVAISTPANGSFVADPRLPLNANYADPEPDSGLDLSTLRLSLDGVTVESQPRPWTATTPLPKARQAPAVTASNGYLYVVGGAVSGIGLSNSVVFARIEADGKLGSWTETTPIPTARQNHRALAVGGKLYLLGGHDNVNFNLNDVYFAQINADGTLGAWTPTASLHSGRGTFGAVSLNGFIYVIGGETPACDAQAFFAKINADGTLGAWAAAASLPQGRAKFAASVVHRTIYVAGGDCDADASPNAVLYSKPDPATGALGVWQLAQAMPKPVTNVLGLAARGRLFILGGQSPSGSPTKAVLSAAVNPDLSVSAWTDNPNFYLPEALTLAGADAWNDRLYLVGGNRPDGSSSDQVFLAPITTHSSVAAFTPAATLPDGPHTVSASISDLAGNPGSVQSLFTVDQTTPVTRLDVRGSSRSFEGILYIPDRPELRIAAEDPLVNGSSSGVKATSLSINGTPSSTGAFTLADGTYTLAFFSADHAGNVEPLRIVTVLSDGAAPMGVTDLSAVDPSTSALTLSWTSPGDNGELGTIASGELRVQYSTAPVDFSTAAAQVVQGVANQVPGQTRSLRITGLEKATTYFFALWTRDTAGNYSAISNISQARTLSLASSPDAVASLAAPVEGITVSSVTAAEAPGAFAVAATTQVLKSLTTAFYELTPPGGGKVVFSTPAVLSFVFDPTGVDLSQVFIFRFNGVEWDSGPVVNQTFTFLADGMVQISGLLFSASLYGVFERLDLEAPRTTAVIGSPRFTAADGAEFVTPATPVTFTAVEPPIVRPGGSLPGSGVKRIEVAADGGTFAPFVSALFFAEGRHTILFRAVDNAGNVEVGQILELRSDGSAPRVEIQSPRAGDRFVATRGTLTVRFSVTDNFDPAPRFEAALVQREDRGSARGPRPARVPAAPGQSFEPLDLDDGLWEFVVSATDFVQNSTAASGGPFEVVHDTLPPRTSLTVGTPRSGADPVFATRDTAFTLSSIDDLVSPEDGQGLGVALQELSVNGVLRSRFANPNPAIGQAFASTFTLADADGLYTLAFLAQDTLGNREAARLASVALDNTAPRTVLAITGGRQLPGPDASSFYASAETAFGFAAADPIVNGAASGVRPTRFQDNGGAFAAFASTFSLAEGIHRLSYQSEDNVANLEVLRSTTALVDATPPVSSLAIGEPKFDPGGGALVFVATRTPLSLSVADPIVQEVASGVRLISLRRGSDPFGAFTAAFTMPLPEGVKTLDYFADDNVGNAEVSRSTSVLLDATPPVVSSSFSRPPVVRPPATEPWFPEDFLIVWSATDAASGVGFVDPPTSVTAEGRGLVFIGRARDRVENKGSLAVLVNLDKTPPVVRAGPPIQVFEGGAARLEGSVTDNLDVAPAAAWDFGDGSGATTPVATHTYLDNAAFLAVLSATDHAGHASSDAARVTVLNAPPRVAPLGDRGALEGAFVSVVSTFTDPGVLDTHTAAVDWGDGHRSTAAVTESRDSGIAVASHAYGDNGIYTVTVTVTDKDGGVGTSTFTVTVSNVTPTLASLPSLKTDEGSFIQLPPAAFTDPGFDNPAGGTLEDFAATIDWGDGTSEPAGDIALPETPGGEGVLTRGTIQAKHAYGDNGSYTVTVTVRDDDGGMATSTFTVAVDNVAPAVDAGRDQVAAAGGAVIVGGAIPVRTLAVLVPGEPQPRTLPIGPSEPVAIPPVSYSDPGFDNPAGYTREDFTASIDWGDQTSSIAPEAALTEVPGREGVPTTGSVSAPHRYTANGIYLSKPTVTDDDQGAGSGSMRITADVVPPDTSISHAGNVSLEPGLPPGASVFLAGAATSLLSATDPAVNGIAFGVQWTFRRDNSIDGTSAPFTLSNSPFNLPQEGVHILEWFSVDNRGNEEGHKLLTIAVDTTPPASRLSIGEPRYRLADILLVSSRTPFAFPAFDPVSSKVASGLKDTFYRVSDEAPGTAPFGTFTATFTLAAPDVIKLIEFRSRDKVLNTEVVRSSTVLLDSTPPKLALLSPPVCDSGICRVLKGRFPVVGTAKDLHFRDYRLEYAPLADATSGFVLISSGGVGVSSASLGVWDTRALAGWLTLRLTAADLVENASALAVNVFVGDPGELLTLGDHELFNMPEGVAVGSDGKIYVADRNDDRIAVFSATGTLLASFGAREHEGHGKPSTATLRLNKPSGVAVDGAGNIYVADTNNDRVLKLSAAGELLLDIGRRKVEREDGKAEGEFKSGRGPGEFKKPSGVAVDAVGGIYVSDRENHRVQVFTSTGGFAFLFSLPPAPKDDEDDEEKDEADGEFELGKPSGIALDAAGRIYVADPKGRRALVFGKAGQLLLSIPITGDKPGETGQPHGVAVSESGNCLLVSDRKLGRILKFDSQGSGNLVFGSKGKLKDDEERQKAGIVLNKPMGLALDAAGNLYVADRNNDRIRKFGLPTGQPPLIVPPPRPDNEHVARDVVDREDGGEVRRKDKAAVAIPAKALGEDLKISVSTPAAGQMDESNRRKALADLALKPASPPVEFSPEGTTFEKPVTLTLPYSPKLAEAQGVAEDDLKVAYWNRDKGRWEELESSVDKKSKTVRAKTAHFSLYQVISGTASARAAEALPQADPTFLFRDLYVFPNPARGGAKPTIHLAVGVADKVTLRIFDVAGREARRAALDGPPQIIDDGSGPKFAYEYAWDGHIPSGVYLFTVEAEKAGTATVRKAGRFAVVR